MSNGSEMPSFISRQVVRGRYFFGDGDGWLRVRCVGDEECTMDYEMVRTGFMYHAVELVVSGQWELEMGGRVYAVGPGAMFGYGPSSGYRLRVVGGVKPRKYFMDFDGGGVDAFLTSMKLAMEQPVLVASTVAIEHGFEQLLGCGQVPEEWVAGHTAVLAEWILRMMAVANQRCEDRDDRAFGTYQRARQVLLEDAIRLKGVEELARRVGVSAAYLSRIFKKYGGESPLVFLMRVKMQYAADLLTRRSVRVGEAGLAVGYEDPYHFSRVFKKVHGVSPSAYVKRKLRD